MLPGLIATQLTKQFTILQRFGIGHMTGIDLAGEVNYPLSIAGDPNWYPVNLGTNSFGQGVATTPIQMITAVSAIANLQGRIMAPHVLRSVIEDGEKYNNPPQVIGTRSSRYGANTPKCACRGNEASIACRWISRGQDRHRRNSRAGGYSTPYNASFVGWTVDDPPSF